MKKYRGQWEDDIVRYMFKTYEHTVITKKHCDNCPFYIAFDEEFIVINNSLYFKTKDGKKMPIDNIEKKCNNICVFYY